MKKILVISDLHLSNKFNEQKFNFLKKLFSSEKYKQIIILGDFFEGYLMTIDEFLKSNWSKLFPILKKKNTIYIPGNHDYCAFEQKEKTKIFADIITKKYLLKIKNKKILFTHGDIYLPTIDNYLKNIPFFLKKILFKFSKYEKKHYQRTIFYLKKTKSALTKDNLKIIKKFKKTNYKNKINWLITGHSHNPIISKKFHYIDVGFFEENFHSYLEISYQGIFNLITKNKNLTIKQKI